MKTYNYVFAVLLFIVFADKSFAQYPILKIERISTPWDLDTTVIGNYADISLTQEGKLILLYVLPYPIYLPSFYFYDEKSKMWSKKQLSEEKWKIHNFYKKYTFDFKTVLGYEETGKPKFQQAMKWIFNYGDSLLLDTIKNGVEYTTAYFVTPTLTFLTEYQYDPEFTYNNFTYKPANVSLYSRNKYGDDIDTRRILTLSGGHKFPQSQQYYTNSMEVVPIDDETIVVGVRREYWTVPMNGDYTKEVYTLLLTKTSENRISDTINLPRRNNDGQFFLKRDLSTYLYSSPRHGIMSDSPVNFGFIDKHLKDVEIKGEYANGKKGYYCLCNNKTNSDEFNKFLIYSIDSMGNIQKFLLPNSRFDYPNISSTDSSITYSQIIYADDSIMYVRLKTEKSINNEYYFTQPQLYKIYLKETVNSVAEQPPITPLQLYPNPTDHTLRWNTASGTAIITDALGRQLIEVPATAMEADVSGLAVGMYFLTIRNGVESVARSFVVVR